MGIDAWILLLTLVVLFVLFIWDRWRYDLVSIGALLFLSVVGIVPRTELFSGFSHPAVSTVVAVLIISRGLQNSGILEQVAARFSELEGGFTTQLLLLCGFTGLLSAFVNNIGALAITMPLALQAARSKKLSPSLYLMPIAFSSLLGGLTTLIGTPPNIIVSGARQQLRGEAFGLFDYAFVGVPVAVVTILMIGFVGWRLVPVRKKPVSDDQAFEVGDYTTELVVPRGSAAVGKTFADLQDMVDGEIVLLVAASKSGRRQGDSKQRKIKVGDILVIEGPPEAIKGAMEAGGLHIASNRELEKQASEKETLLLTEVAVAPTSTLAGRMPRAATLRRHYRVALLAVARHGRRLRQRFSRIRLKVGDVLLIRGEQDDVAEMLRDTNCLPLATRDVRIGTGGPSYATGLIFLGALLLLLFQLLPAQLAFAIGAVAMVLQGSVPVRAVYQAVDWSIVILLGALLPVGVALETTGAAEAIVRSLLGLSGELAPQVMLAVLLIGVMFLSDFVNNAAAAALSAPIALRMAQELNASPDPFLMAVAIGASCAFLTPVGHQSNTLVMGPGGYRFMDYWRLGLPIEGLVVVIAVPSLLYFWPL